VQTHPVEVTARMGTMEYVQQVQRQAMSNAGIIGGHSGPLKVKNAERVLEKSGMRADMDHQYEVEIVCDVVRAGLAYVSSFRSVDHRSFILSRSHYFYLRRYGSVAEIQTALEMLLACDDGQFTLLDRTNTRGLLLGGVEDAPSIVVVRIKDRFCTPTSGGWADVMVNFYFASDPNKHVVELQVCAPLPASYNSRAPPCTTAKHVLGLHQHRHHLTPPARAHTPSPWQCLSLVR
jgi:hypothetical protein